MVNDELMMICTPDFDLFDKSQLTLKSLDK